MTERYPNFDLYRLLLALQVVFAHAAFMVGTEFPINGFPAFATAVPAFLSISGFLVLQSREHSAGIADFAIRRCLRLVPALLLSFLICWILQGQLMATNSILVWLTSGIWFVSGPANGPLWSLFFEQIAYLALALLWLVGAYRRPLLIWALLAISFVLCRIYSSPATGVILLLPPAFLIGNLMYLHRAFLLRAHWALPLIALPICLFWLQHRVGRTFGAEGVLVVQVVPIVWFAMAGPRIIPKRIPDISFGLYIYHWPVLAWFVEHQAPMNLQSLLLIGGPALIMLSLLSWYIIEAPALKLKKRRSPDIASEAQPSLHQT